MGRPESEFQEEEVAHVAWEDDPPLGQKNRQGRWRVSEGARGLQGEAPGRPLPCRLASGVGRSSQNVQHRRTSSDPAHGHLRRECSFREGAKVTSASKPHRQRIRYSIHLTLSLAGHPPIHPGLIPEVTPFV